MGEIKTVIPTEKGVCIICTDLLTEIEEEVKKYRMKGAKNKDIRIKLDDSDMNFDLDTFRAMRENLDNITGDIKEADDDVEKFTKVAMAIYKNIKYDDGKTKEKNIGRISNFSEGLTKGKCVCCGYTDIFNLAMQKYGIETSYAKSQNHAWSKVNLEGLWYNWDQTRMPEIHNIGTSLKTDKQISNKKYYQEEEKKAECNTKPSKELVKRIRKCVKENKRNVPKVFDRNPFTFFKKKIQNYIGKQDIKLLPEAKAEIPEEWKSKRELLKGTTIMENRDVFVWEIQTCQREDPFKKIETSYLGVPKTGNLQAIIDSNPEEFWEMYEKLKQEAKEQKYIGNIMNVEGDKKELYAAGLDSEEATKTREESKEAINKYRESTKIEPIENKKEKDNLTR